MKLRAEQLPGALARGVAPIYLVSGNEPLLVDEAADQVRAAARKAGYQDRRVFFVERGFSWDQLFSDTQSLSLFAERRLFELRMPSGKPDKGAAQLEAMATRPPPDVVTLVITDQLDRKVGDSAWVRAIEAHGVWVTAWPVDASALPEWLRARARERGISLTPQAGELIAARVEGNLLAARQELDKLALLAGKGPVDEALVLRAVADSARYDVFQLAGAAAAGDAPRALQVLMGLKSEGVEPPLILWALTRELRGLWQARERERLHSNARGSAWNLAAPPSSQALARLRKLPLPRLLVQASRVDRIIKGQIRGDAWSAITGLTASFAGALQGAADSGRVAS